MPAFDSKDGFEDLVKSALGKQIGDGFQHTGPHPALRDQMMFEAGKAAQGRADRKYFAGSLFLGLAGGWLFAFLPAQMPLGTPTPRGPSNDTPFVKVEEPKSPAAASNTLPAHPSTIWHARVDPKQIDDPPPDLSGTEFVHVDHPMTVRSLPELLKELQP